LGNNLRRKNFFSFNIYWAIRGPIFSIYEAHHTDLFSKYMIMKNTTSQETSYPIVPLRVAFRNEEIVEEKKTRRPRRSRRSESKVQPSKPTPPMFDDYRFKARDHDPL